MRFIVAVNDASVDRRLAAITERAQYDAMNAALLVLGAFVLLALIAALFLPKGRLADKKHPPDPEEQRYDKRAPYPERGTWLRPGSTWLTRGGRWVRT